MFVMSKSVCPNKPFQPRLMFPSKAGAHPGEEPTVRLDGKCLPGTNALAYYTHSYIRMNQVSVSAARWQLARFDFKLLFGKKITNL